jgi:hypothetical protein
LQVVPRFRRFVASAWWPPPDRHTVTLSPLLTTKGNRMNLIKHMEAVFIASVTFAVGGSYLADRLPEAHAKAPLVAAAPAATQVVVIKARRMSAAEKRASAAGHT